ncbi:MAG: 3-keto-5-aminohexanoate cleavage protein [Pseudomonadota bacterium]
MTSPAIICVAITGSLPRKSDNPAVPITISEQIESTHAAFEAGAAIAHCHVRKDDGSPTSDPDRFAALLEGIRIHCPGMIVQLSTGGRSGAGQTRGGMIPLGPDMCSLSVGSNNFPTRVYENPPDLVDWLAAQMAEHDVVPEIECFDLSHLYQAAQMHKDGRLPRTPYCQFVMGVKNAMPADKVAFDAMLTVKRHLFGDAPWCAAGIGRHQIELNDWAAAAGGHLRTGLEDNIRLDRNTPAPSNAALVARAVEVAAKHGRTPASVDEARQILGLKARVPCPT